MSFLTIRFAGDTDQGLVRPENEDNWKACPDMRLFLVADGMGGRQAGFLASQAVVEMLPLLLRQSSPDISNLAGRQAKKIVATALATLSSEISGKAREEPELAGMGSTVVVAVILKTTALIAHLGDSRAYLLRNGRLRPLTKDHNLAQILLDAGSLTPEEAERHPGRNQLTRFVGMAGEPLPQVRLVPLKAEDRILLCSDGLTKEIREEEIRAILLRTEDPPDACRELIAAARASGARDNVTVLVLALAGENEDGAR